MLPKELYDRAGAKIYKEFRHADIDVINFLLRFIRNNAFLDAGCGTGNNLSAIYERNGLKGYGCDLSPDMVEIARDRECAEDLSVTDLDNEFPSRWQFEVIYAMDMIHHLKKTEVFFKNSFSHLAPNGYLLVGTESEEDLRKKLISQYFSDALNIDLARYRSVEKLRQIALNVGFRTIIVEELGGEIEVTQEYIQQCRNKAHSVLLMLGEGLFQVGLEHLETDFESGRLKFRNVGYTFIIMQK